MKSKSLFVIILVFMAAGITNTAVACLNLPPVAIIEEPVTIGGVHNLWQDAAGNYHAVVNDTIRFDGTESYDPEETTLSYEWDVDDGSGYVSGNNTKDHSYSSEGTYTIKLRVTDSGSPAASDEDSVCVIVGPRRVHNVTKDIWYSYIQLAIDLADEDDEIEAEESLYLENINFKGKNLTISSTDPTDASVVASTIINGDPSKPVVQFDGSETSSASINGFTISSNPDLGLVAHWKLDSETSGVTGDSSENGNDGDLEGGASITTTIDDHLVGAGALNLDGTDGYVEITGYEGITGTQSRAVSAWIKTDSTNGAIVYWGTNTSGALWSLHLNTTGTGGAVQGALQLSVGNGYKIVGSTYLADDKWHHVAAVLVDDGSPTSDEVYLYVDGVQETLSYYDEVSIDTDDQTDMLIGKIPSSTFFDGQIDDVRIFSRELASFEIQALYDAVDVDLVNKRIAAKVNGEYTIGASGNITFATFVSNFSDYSDCYLELEEGVDLSSYSSQDTALIGPDTVNSDTSFDGTAFTGFFEGNGHILSDLTIDGGTTNDFVGLFGKVGSTGVIHNVRLEDCDVMGDRYVGGLVSLTDGRIIDCHVSCDGTKNISGVYFVGGLVGYSHGSIDNCHATVSVEGSYYAGGLAGLAESLDNSYATGSVSGINFIGGLVGAIYGDIENCYATGDVNGNDYVGGLGGLGGSYDTIENSYAIGNVTGHDKVGGLVGSASGDMIGNCYAAGDVSGHDKVGGFAGSASSTKISNCSAKGLITWTGSDIGGFVGNSSSTDYICKSYWNSSDTNSSLEGIGNITDPTEVIPETTAYFATIDGVFNRPGIMGGGATATISYCVVRDNTASKYGGGIARCDGVIENCTVMNNRAENDGGGLYHCDGTITNCIVMNNTAENGGGIANCNGLIVNSIIAENTTAVDAAAVLGNTDDSTGTIINCTIAGNSASGSVGGIKDYAGTITNTILWGNTDGDVGTNLKSTQIKDCAGSVTYSCIESDTGVYSGDGNIDDDPLFSGTGDYHISSTSPCCNAGYPFGVYEGQTDIDGEDRILESPVDIGADEESSDIIYVDINATGAGTGVDWENAYTSIQDAIDDESISGGEVILVAPGTYEEEVDFGGAAVKVTSTNPYDPDIVASTVIDPMGGPTQVDVYGVTFNSTETTASVIEGFTITGSYFGVYIQNSSPTVSRCVIKENGRYGFVIAGTSSPEITECTINNNSEAFSKAGILVNPGASPTITQCDIKDNWGCGIWLYQNNTTVDVSIDECIIANNSTHGIWIYGCSSDITANITQCTILQNGEHGIYNQGGGATVNISQSTLEGESKDWDYGIYDDGSSSNITVAQCTITKFHRGVINQSSMSLSNCIVADNVYCGVVSHYSDSSDSLSVINCTVVGNGVIGGGGGGIDAGYGTPAESVIVKNNIVWNNSGADLRYCTATYSCVQDNQDAFPIFLDILGPDKIPQTGDEDYHLWYASPCRGQGDDGSDLGAYGGIADIVWEDEDSDGLHDDWERYYWPNDQLGDHDEDDHDDQPTSDGLSNLVEFNNGPGWDPTKNDAVYNEDTGQGYASIQAAIDAASESTVETIIVPVRTYIELIDFGGTDVYLKSTDPTNSEVVDTTIIYPADRSENVVTFDQEETSACILEGFSLLHGNNGVYIADSSPIVRNCSIKYNENGGIYLYEYGASVASSVEIVSCLISKNRSGINCYQNYTGDSIFIDITESVISENTQYGINSLAADSFDMTGSTVSKNGYEGVYGGVLDIQNCIITNNGHEGIYSSSAGSIINCTLYGNDGGIYGNVSDVIKNCIIWNTGDALKDCSSTYSCIDGPETGDYVIHTDPVFVDAGTNDFHLHYSSPCIGVGYGGCELGAYGNTSEATIVVDENYNGGSGVGDGMSDDWQEEYWSNFDPEQQSPSDPAHPELSWAPDTDSDGDGLSNLEEYCLGWDPQSDDSANIIGIVTNQTTTLKYPSISSAISYAEFGNVLQATAGIYTEQIDFRGKPIYLKGANINDPSLTTITCSILGQDIVEFVSGETSNSKMEGFTISGSSRHGIYIDNTSYPEISKCVITANQNDGIHITNNSYPLVNQCTISYNGEDGVTNNEDSHSSITACLIENNTRFGSNVASNESPVTFTACEITANNGDAGLYCTGNGYLVAQNCILTNNTNGLYSIGESVLEVSGCTVSDNTNGFNINKSPVFIDNSFIRNNSASGVLFNNDFPDYYWDYIEANGTLNVVNCTIISNGASGIQASENIPPQSVQQLKNCIIWGNNNDLVRCSATYSCIEDLDIGEGVIHAPPQFRDEVNDDYRLWYASPCIGTGDDGHEMGAYGDTSDETDWVDTDSDGLHDQWELTYFPNLDQVKTGNPDGDSCNNWVEYLFRYHPNDAQNPDNPSMQIIFNKLSVARFNPRAAEDIEIEYWINKDASNVTTTIYPSETGSPSSIKTISEVSAHPAGVNAVVWDGTDDTASAIVEKGLYDFTISTTPTATYNAIPAETLTMNPYFWIEDYDENATTKFQNYNPYQNLPIQIYCSVPEWGKVTIKVREASEGPDIHSFMTDNWIYPGLHKFDWYGYKTDNTFYDSDFEVYATGIASKIGVIPVWYETDVLNNLRCNPYRILPLSDEVSVISYHLDCDADVTIDIYEPDGTWHFTILPETHQLEGDHQVIWHGRDEASGTGTTDVYYNPYDPTGTYTTQGEYVSMDTEGVYRVIITAEDTNDNVIGRLNGSVTVFK